MQLSLAFISERVSQIRMTGRAPLQPTNSTNLPQKPRPLPSLPGFKPPHIASSYASRPANLSAPHIKSTSSVSTTASTNSRPLTAPSKPLSSSLGKPTVVPSSTSSSRPAGQTATTTNAMAPPRYFCQCSNDQFFVTLSFLEGHVLVLPRLLLLM